MLIFVSQALALVVGLRTLIVPFRRLTLFLCVFSLDCSGKHLYPRAPHGLLCRKIDSCAFAHSHFLPLAAPSWSSSLLTRVSYSPRDFGSTPFCSLNYTPHPNGAEGKEQRDRCQCVMLLLIAAAFALDGVSW